METRSDIVERLRGWGDDHHGRLMREAADEIERLREEVSRLLGSLRDEVGEARDYRDAAEAEIERLRAAPVSEAELNFIKAFWRASPSCMGQNCNADCNPMTAHCGRGP